MHERTLVARNALQNKLGWPRETCNFIIAKCDAETVTAILEYQNYPAMVRELVTPAALRALGIDDPETEVAELV